MERGIDYGISTLLTQSPVSQPRNSLLAVVSFPPSPLMTLRSTFTQAARKPAHRVEKSSSDANDGDMQQSDHNSRVGPKKHLATGISVLTMAKAFMLILLVSDMVPAVIGHQKFGSLRLCPAGGRAFQMAWNLACDMKKRKRRGVNDKAYFGAPDGSAIGESTVVKRDYRPATLSDIMQICCEVGCEIRDLLAYCDPFGAWNS